MRLSAFCLTLCWAAAALPLQAGVHDEAEPAVQREVQRLIKAICDRDYEAFISQGTLEHRATKKTEFVRGVTRYRSRLLSGYDLTYLTSLRQNGNANHVWKLSPKDGSDDVIVRLILKDGVVHVFTIQ